MLAELGLTCQIKIVVIERFDGRWSEIVNPETIIAHFAGDTRFNIRGKKNKSTTASSKENAILRGAGKLTAASLLGRDNNFLSLGDSAGYTCKS
ncbi:hypothetical protein J6590_010816 [Homalodisca vitripennis]|nr:hypothetical protein J6590_010816 [Homalodisca vitripennis]